jgi:hypothetical protein
MRSEKNLCAEIFPANAYLDYHDPEAELSQGFEWTTDHAVKDMTVPKRVVRIFRQSFEIAFICSAASQRLLQNR